METLSEGQKTYPGLVYKSHHRVGSPDFGGSPWGAVPGTRQLGLSSYITGIFEKRLSLNVVDYIVIEETMYYLEVILVMGQSH